MLRLEARNSQTPVERKPEWIKTRLRTGPQYTELKQLVRREGLHTVCEEAGCPNIFECWEDREATFLIGGDQCTRRCDFCQIATGKPQPLDRGEPAGAPVRLLGRLAAAGVEAPAPDPTFRRPEWMKVKADLGPGYRETQRLMKEGGLHTVCQEAGCPNIFECWEDREATFLIGGDQCTRRCDFCQIDTGKPLPLDRDEPRRVAESVAATGLRYATVTGVARDDQPDGGSWLYAQTAREIHAAVPGCGVELLVPDFNADPAQLGEVFSARPEVFAHNLETVPRIFKRIRPGFRYERSLDVLRQAHAAGMVTKSNLILGMGETREEIAPAMADLRAVGVDLLTITQYLRPSARHHPVDRWVRPEEFVELREEALAMGFAGVMSGPLVRSSYRAGKLYAQAIEQRSATAAS